MDQETKDLFKFIRFCDEIFREYDQGGDALMDVKSEPYQKLWAFMRETGIRPPLGENTRETFNFYRVLLSDMRCLFGKFPQKDAVDTLLEHPLYESYDEVDWIKFVDMRLRVLLEAKDFSKACKFSFVHWLYFTSLCELARRATDFERGNASC